MKIAGIGDLHMNYELVGYYSPIFSKISEDADILCLCGDLTDHGNIAETQMLLEELKVLNIPVIAVLGNHEYGSEKEEDIKKELIQNNIFVLGDEPYIYNDVGFAGTKGFIGGFDKYMLRGFGEQALKELIFHTVNETLILQNSLAQLETKKKIVILHYSPIRQTLTGEPLEIFPFLGSSRLAEPIDAFDVDAVFHGHAHHGSAKGKTLKGTPVYNSSFPFLQKIYPKKPFALIEI